MPSDTSDHEKDLRKSFIKSLSYVQVQMLNSCAGGDITDEDETLIEEEADKLMSLFTRALQRQSFDSQTNAVAWCVSVVDEMHIDDTDGADRIYKGVKNRLRDRYKAETGIDPAPRYPVEAKLQPDVN